MPNKVYIATSIDGYIARADGDLDWLNNIPNPHGDDFGYSKFMETIDALVMGRNTFATVLSFGGDWPYSKKVYVLTRSLKEVDSRLIGKVEFLANDLDEAVSMLRARGHKNLYIDGGKVIQSFLEKDLIDEMTITRVPVLLGEGIPLFRSQKIHLNFSHMKTEIFENGLIKTSYQRIRSE